MVLVGIVKDKENWKSGTFFLIIATLGTDL
jgi:hypothetical protein